MITGLTHPGISVSNLETWLAFIRNNLNASHISSQVSDQDYLEKVTGLKGAKLKIGFVRFGENSFPLEVVEYLHPKGCPSGSSYGRTGSPHICFDVADAEALHTINIKNGVKVSDITHHDHAFWGKYKSYALYAPDNIPIKVIELEGHALEMDSSIQIHHTSLTVSDCDSALAFLCGNLGLNSVCSGNQAKDCLAPNLVTNYHYEILEIPGHAFTIELRQFISSASSTTLMAHNNFGSLHHCFQVDDIFNDYETLNEVGVHFVGPPAEVTAGINKGAYAIYFYGFDGYRFEIFQRMI